MKVKCTPSSHGRQVHRSFHADYLERVKGYYQTEAYQRALRKRKVWVEPLFGEAKEWHGMRRFRLRHLWKVNCEALVTATGQNLKRLLKKRGWGRRPFPTEAMVLMSPGSDEVEMFPETALLRSQRANVAVASLVFWEITTRFFMAQKSLFSPENIAHVIFVLCSLYIILSIYYCFYRFRLYFLLWEKLWSVYLINFIISPTESFSTGCGRF
ncbi:MAG TPA: transposase [Ktedonosporobacter sp.]|nr:transposase [Ktedonosporobacter sp.]